MDPVEQLIAIGDDLRANPRPFQDLDPQTARFVLTLLTPGPQGWSELQNIYVPRWYLKTSDEEVASANHLLATAGCARVGATHDTAGDAYLPASLLADSGPGSTYAPIGPWLKTLILRYSDDIVWPTEIEQP